MIREIPKTEVNPWLEEYEMNHEINEDYIAKLSFDSGLLDLPVLKSDDYDKYLRTDWKSGEYEVGGSIFIDPNANLDSSNITIYGHNYDSGDKMFTPLHQLKDEANYASNCYLTLSTKDEIRRYIVADVAYVEIKEMGSYQYLDDLNYMLSEYDEITFDKYMKALKKVEFYDTKVKLKADSHLLTMQTCVSNRPDLRLIVVAKEIENIKLR